MNAGVAWTNRYSFNTTFAMDWFLGQKLGLARTGSRAAWHAKMMARMQGAPLGRELQVERRRDLSPEQFRREYFLTGKPVVLEGIASEWPAVKTWTFDYLLERCGHDVVDVLDGHNWKVQAILEPGDVLWNPPWVWHGVQNLTESIAVSMWWANVARTFSNDPVLTPLAFLGRPNPVLLQLGLAKEPTEKRSAFSVHLNR